MTGLDVDARRQFTLRKPMGLTLFFQHSSELVVCIHGTLIQQAALDLPSSNNSQAEGTYKSNSSNSALRSFA
jgi:hypothetical protein